ncbi:MAG: hypothetical protein V3U79_04840 [Dehalococcoidia bacterium]
MRSQNVQLGLAEYVGLAGLLLAGVAVGFGVASGWIIAIGPGITYIVAGGAAYLIYRQHKRERAKGWRVVPSTTEHMEQATARPSIEASLAQTAGMIAFRVVGARGACPLGRNVKDLIYVDPEGAVTPQVCLYAQATLRMAAAEEGEDEVAEWCCPIYDHLLVFRREPEAV